MKRNLVLAIVGPTASGKSRLAVELALKIGGEIICLDSATVYRGLDIGTSRPSEEDRAKVAHHLLDLLNPDEPFSAYHFVEEAQRAILAIHERERIPIVVGGTYFYLRALQNGMYPETFVPDDVIEAITTQYGDDENLDGSRIHAALKEVDEKAAAKIHPNDKYRLVRALGIWKAYGKRPSEQKVEKESNHLWLKYALIISRRELNNAIVRRTEMMLGAGLVAEVRALEARFPSARSLGAIGYQECVRFLHKEITDKQLRSEMIEHTRQLAKRQMTWIRSDPEIRVIDSRDLDRICLEVENLRFAMETPP